MSENIKVLVEEDFVLNPYILNPSIGDSLEGWIFRNLNCFTGNEGKLGLLIKEIIDIQSSDQFILKSNETLDREMYLAVSISQYLREAKMYEGISTGIIKIPRGEYNVVKSEQYKEMFDEYSEVWDWDINGVKFNTREMRGFFQVIE